MKDAKIMLADDDVRRGAVIKFLNQLKHLKAAQRQLIAAEFATRLWMRSLDFLRPLYDQFEDELWMQLAGEANLDKLIIDLALNHKVLVDARTRYYVYIQTMFKRSKKSREEFYNEMLVEAGVEIELGEVDFGEKAVAFGGKTIESVHQEHLLVWYSARLLLKAHRTIYPTHRPISESALEILYKHFEDAIPLCGKFRQYSSSISHFEPDVRLRLLPSLY